MLDTPGEPAPKSDMRIDLRPVGETSRKSTSAGKAWLNPFRVTDTRCTTPTSPATVMVDGKSDAVCPVAGQGLGQSVIVMGNKVVKSVAIAGADIDTTASITPTPRRDPRTTE